MIDSHCHLNFKAFNEDVEEVITNAFQNGMTAIVNVGTKLESSEKALSLANSHNNLYAAVGIHPHHADEYSKDVIAKIEQLTQETKVVAIGEIGLDNHVYGKSTKPTTSKDMQILAFRNLLSLAQNVHLPVAIHNREAFDEIYPIIKGYKNLTGMFHCWSENSEAAKKVLDLGFFVSFTGIVTFKDALQIQEVAKMVPLEKILIETDSPFLSPIPLRGLRNVPQNVKIVAEKIAQLRGITRETVISQTTLNAKKLFSI